MKTFKFGSHLYTSSDSEPIINLESGVGKTINLKGTITANGIPIGSGSILTNDLVALVPGADCTVFDNCTTDISMGLASNNITLGNTTSTVLMQDIGSIDPLLDCTVFDDCTADVSLGLNAVTVNVGSPSALDTEIVLNGFAHIAGAVVSVPPILNGISDGTRLILDSSKVDATHSVTSIGVNNTTGGMRMFFGLDQDSGSNRSFDFYAGATRIAQMFPFYGGGVDSGGLSIAEIFLSNDVTALNVRSNDIHARFIGTDCSLFDNCTADITIGASVASTITLGNSGNTVVIQDLGSFDPTQDSSIWNQLTTGDIQMGSQLSTGTINIGNLTTKDTDITLNGQVTIQESPLRSTYTTSNNNIVWESLNITVGTVNERGFRCVNFANDTGSGGLYFQAINDDYTFNKNLMRINHDDGEITISGPVTSERVILNEENKVGTTINTFDSTMGGLYTKGDLVLDSASKNTIFYENSGIGLPTLTNRSVGTKICYNGAIGASATDFATGIATAVLWNSVPTSSQRFEWYAANNEIMQLDGFGNLAIQGSLSQTPKSLSKYTNVLQSVTISTGTDITFPSVDYDTTSGYNFSSTQFKNTSSDPQYWLVGWTLWVTTSTTGDLQCSIISSTGERYASCKMDFSNKCYSASSMILVGINETLKLNVFNSGATVDVNSTNVAFKTRMWMKEM